ncbi:MAG: hypothetical protein ACR2M9_03660 [Cyanophyceae cyanobacterium]
MKIKIIIYALIIFLGSLSVSSMEPNKFTQSQYEQGWADGFCEGWKDIKGQWAYCPYTPYAPYPKYNCNEGYRCGYNRGFKYGICKARNTNCEK